MSKFVQDPSMLLVVVNHNKDIKPRTMHLDSAKFEHYKNLLFSYIPNIDDEVKFVTRPRILVELNTKMFKFEIKAKETVSNK